MKQVKKNLPIEKKRGGFTMVELLLVVAILVVLFALAVGGLVQMKKNLRQKELDAKAEIIYAAAQNRMAELRAAGYGSTLTDETRARKMADIPTDAVIDTVTRPAFYYVISADKGVKTALADDILPETNVDPELWSHHWLIEYNGDTGLVYAVFYSETGEISTDETVRGDLRLRDKRLAGGAKVGYYGGDITLGGKSYTLVPDLSIVNEEELVVKMSCVSPNVGDGLYPSLRFSLTLTDKLTGAKVEIPSNQISVTTEGKDLYKAELILDSLEYGERRRFSTLFPSLTPGNNIDVVLTVTADSRNVLPKTLDPVETSSLFATENYQKNLLGQVANANKANIAYRRHLQNLDTTTSHVKKEITDAYLVKELDFRKSTGETAGSFYSFKPITNVSLKTFSGKDQKGQTHTIKNLYLNAPGDGGSTGLFDTFYGTSISDVILTNTRASGTAEGTGALIGKAVGKNTKLTGCQVYLTDSLIGKFTAQEDVTRYLRGDFVGGLVGIVDTNAGLTVEHSFAATTARADRGAGGAVGLVRPSGKIAFTGSYTDCYLRGERTGGVVGWMPSGASLEAQDFYTAGYQYASAFSAGVVPGTEGKVAMHNGYCAVSYKRANDGTAIYTSAAESANWSKVYAMEPGVENALDVDERRPEEKKTSRVSSADLAEGSMVGGRLVANTFAANVSGGTTAYNLLGQGLDNYPSPRLRTGSNAATTLRHYGDWEETPTQWSLAYYEQYTDGTYGFYGSGVRLSESAEIQEDGYGILVRQLPAVGDSWTVRFTDRNKGDHTLTYEVTAANTGTVAVEDQNGAARAMTTAHSDGKTYYLLKLGTEEIQVGENTVSLADAIVREDGSFYSRMSIAYTPANGSAKTETYWFNPHFAKSVVASTERPANPQTIYVRSVRHLAALSGYYTTGWTPEKDDKKDFATTFANSGSTSYTFLQERNLDWSSNYDWTAYHRTKNAYLTPIGGTLDANAQETPFAATYDGQTFEIRNLSIRSVGLQIGLFGRVGSTGVVKNVILVGNANEQGTNAYVGRGYGTQTVLQTTADQLSQGALVGYNDGTVSNCAVAGYRHQLAAFSRSSAYVGGLVGTNAGTIESCAADTPDARFRFTSATGRIGGLVGNNLPSGSVSGSYALGHLRIQESKTSSVIVAGFAGENSGAVRNSYAACAMEAAGDAELYGFGKKLSGTVVNGYYLDGGTYSYQDTLYSFNASTNEFRANASGTPAAPNGLTDSLGSFGTVSDSIHTKYHPGTKTETDTYTYPAAIRLSDGSYAHFGNWPNQEKDLGTLGVFYWEYESGGPNAGYHLYYLGTSEGLTFSGGNLCTNHDDGGVITSYGYGYFMQPTVVGADIGDIGFAYNNQCTIGESNQTVEVELQKQLPRYRFRAYTTGTGDTRLHLTGEEKNASWNLTYNGTTYRYSVCPFFAQSISYDGNAKGTDEVTTGNDKPGYGTNSYQIRSVQQLQYINWNYSTQRTDFSLSKLSYGGAVQGDDHYWDIFNAGKIAKQNEKTGNDCFPYLLWGNHHNSILEKSMPLTWEQTHDLNGKQEGVTGYTPIGSMFDANSDQGSSIAEIAAFASTYDGHSYAIKNVKISSGAECVGLFGITSGAIMRNVVLYADDSTANTIEVHDRENSDWQEWYCIGGLVGLAGSKNNTASQFTNCTVSGYVIQDNRSRNPGWGGGCVGGLVGATNMKIENCTAVTTIQLKIGYQSAYQNCRVGGLVGALRGTVTNCYAGGKIVNNSTIDTVYFKYAKGTSIWLGGIVGGVCMRDSGTLSVVIGNTKDAAQVSNSYSYVELPGRSGNQKGAIKSSQAIASNGEMQEDFKAVSNDYIVITNCYALESSVTQTDDYLALNGQTSYKGLNLNQSLPNRNERRIELNNDRSPYLNYQQMEEEMGAWLGITDTVTTSDPDTGASIPGKYSYPGTDADLRNLKLNYPFPTVLTQTTLNGSTVNVHYGAWPKLGLYWAQESGTIDLLADRAEEKTMVADEVPTEDFDQPEQDTEHLTAPDPDGETPDGNLEDQSGIMLLDEPEPQAEGAPTAQADSEETPEPPTVTYVSERTFNLKWINITGGGAPDAQNLSFAYYTEDGAEVPDGQEAAFEVEAKRGTYAFDGGSTYTVPITVRARRPGTVVVEAKQGDKYPAKLTVIVTANLEISIAEEDKTLAVYETESKTVPVTLKDTNGQTILGLTQQQLNWSLPQGGENVSWSIAEDSTVPGQYNLTVTGGKAGPTNLTLSDQILSVSYKHDTATDKTFEANTRLSVTVKPSVILGVASGTDYGLGNGKYSPEDYNQVSVPYVQNIQNYVAGKPTEESVAPIQEKNVPLYLYATTDYVNITNFKFVSVNSSAPQSPCIQLTINDQADGSSREQFLYKLDKPDQTAQQDESNEDTPQVQTDTAQAKLDAMLARLEGGQELYVNDEKSYVLLIDAPKNSTDGRGQYRKMTLTDLDGKAPTPQWSLKMCLVRTDKTQKDEYFNLTYNRPNTVRFMPYKEGATEPLKVLRLAQGTGISAAEMKEINSDPALFHAENGYYWKWTLDGIPTGNVDLTPARTGIPFTLSYNGNFPDWEVYGKLPDQTQTYGSITSEALPTGPWTREGMSNTGWFTEDGEQVTLKQVPENPAEGEEVTYQIYRGETEYIPTQLDETLTLYAHWKNNEYSLVFKNGESETVETFVYGTAKEITAPAAPEIKKGHTFAWTDGADFTLQPEGKWDNSAFTPTSDGQRIVLNATWTPETITVTLVNSRDENETVANAKYSYGSALGCPEGFTGPEGESFLGWSLTKDGDVIPAANLPDVLLDLQKKGKTITLYARWTAAATNTAGADDENNVNLEDEQENTDEEPIAPPAQTPNGENTPTPDGENASTSGGEETPPPNGENASTSDGEETPTPNEEDTETPSGEESPTPEGDSESGGADTEESVDPTPVDTQSPDPTPEVPSGEQSDAESPESHEE